MTPPDARSASDARARLAELLKKKAAQARHLPLSYPQQRLWILYKLAPESPLYNIPAAFRLRGDVQPELLQNALNQVIARHEVLRTKFVEANGVAAQVVLADRPIEIERVSLMHLDDAARESKLHQAVHERVHRGFKLESEPLLRCGLFQLGEGDYVGLLVIHHIISDGWSQGLLYREWMACYEALVNGTQPELPPLTIQYADYAAWQQKWLEGEETGRQLSYWQETLSGAEPLALPTDRPRPPVQSYAGETVVRVLPKEIGDRLTKISRANGGTLFMTLLAAYQFCLARRAGTEDVTVGTVVAGRSRRETENLIGLFVNTIPLRSAIPTSGTFREFLDQVRQTASDGFRNQELPFDKIVDSIGERGDLSRNPVCQTFFALQNLPFPEINLAGITVEPYPVAMQTAKFDITLIMRETPDGLVMALEYATALFERATIDGLLDQLTELLERISHDVNVPLGQLRLMSESAEAEVLTKWSGIAEATRPEDRRDIVSMFRRQVLQSPESIALSFADRDYEPTDLLAASSGQGEHRSLTYRDLDELTDRWAQQLRARGVSHESRTAVIADRSAAAVAAFLAICKAGGAFVPLAPETPPERLIELLTSCNVGTAITFSTTTLPALPPGVQTVTFENLASSDSADVALPTEFDPRQLAYVMFTSGSTGTPKAVGVPHQAIVRLVRDPDYIDISPDDVFLQFAPLAFDAATLEVWGALLNGARVHVAPAGPPALDELGRVCREEQVSILWLTSGLFQQMVDFQLDDLKSVRYLLAGGDVVSPSHVRKVLQSLPGTVFVNGYGPTENTTFSCCARIAEADDLDTATVSIGRPIHGTDAYVLDRNFRPVAPGSPGELYVGGIGLARAYVNDPALTAARFVPHPFSRHAGERLYATGDRVRHLSDGRLEFLGRADDQVKIRGFRIEPGEVQNALQGLPGIREAAVLVVGESKLQKRLVGFVVTDAENATELSAEDITRELRASLPDFSIPSRIVFVDELPLTRNGKLDRNALVALCGQDDSTAGRDTTPPQPGLECQIAEFWHEAFDDQHIGRHTNFFEIGGHSLLATQLVARLNREFGIEFPLRKMFEAPTIAGMAETLNLLRQSGAVGRAPKIPVADHTELLPLSFNQQRLWFLEQLAPGQAQYHIPLALRFTGEIDATRLQECFDLLVERHASLRTSIVTIDGKPSQRIESGGRMPFKIVEAGDRDALDSLIRRECAEPFELGNGPLARVTLFRESETSHVLTVVMHHIISDGWSLGVLLREFGAIHAAQASGRAIALPPLELQFADYAAWERSEAAQERLESVLSSACDRLSGVQPLELPTARPRQSQVAHRGEKHEFELPAGLSESLLKLSGTLGTTPYVVLMAAYQQLLGHWSGQEDFAIGSPVAGRVRPELEPTVGFFVNTIAVRSRLNGDATVRQLIESVRDEAAAAFEQQLAPFEKVVDRLGESRDVGRSPVFQTMFAWQNIFDLGQQAASKLPGGLEIEAYPLDGQNAKFELTLAMWEQDRRLRGILEYSADLFDRADIETQWSRFERLLNQWADDPQRRLSDIDLLSDAERATVTSWSHGAGEAVPFAAVHRQFAVHARQTPNAIAVSDGDVEWTYGELDRLAAAVAGRLAELGVTHETRVAVCVPRSIEWIASLLGVLRVGGTYVSLAPDHNAARLLTMVESSGATVLMYDGRIGDGPDADDCERIDVASLTEGTWPTSTIDVDVDPEAAAYMIFTSGSTGTPKGVVVPHRGLANLVAWHRSAYAINASHRATSVASLAFDASVWEIWPYLAAGASLLPVDAETLSDPVRLAEKMQAAGVTHSFLPTPLAEQSLETLSKVSSLQVLLTGGDRLTRQAPKDATYRLVNHYGPTENSVVATAGTVTDRIDDHRLPNIGRPIDGVTAYVVDRQGRLLPPGIPGELWLGGESLARGYVGRGDLTAARFVPNPFSSIPGDRVYLTGDLVRWSADGELEFLGRIDTQLKLRGYRIEPGEIEKAIISTATIAEAAVVLHRSSSGPAFLAAYVVMEDGETLDEASVRGDLQNVLPAYMVPTRVVALAELPLTPNGKVDRRGLERRELTGVATREYTAPRNEREAGLAAIWGELLGLENVGIHDNFFELGGDSILSIQIVSQAAARGWHLTPRDIFEQQTVAQLASVIREMAPVLAEQGPVIGDLAFTPVQRWFLDLDSPEPWHFNQSIFLDVKMPIRQDALAEACSRLLEHHDALRMRVRREDEQWSAVLLSPDEVPGALTWNDLRDADRETQTATIEREAAEIQQSLRLDEGPLFRAAYWQTDDDRGRLLLVGHHMTVDAVSWRIVLEDLFRLYQQVSAGQSPTLPPKTTSLRQWSELLGELADAGRFDNQRDYWTEVCSASNEPFPVDHHDGPNDESRVAMVTGELSPEATESLLRDVPGAYRTQINDILLAALLLTARREMGLDELLIEMEGHGRENVSDGVDLSRTVGWLTSLYPVRLRAEDGDDLGSLIIALKESLRAIPDKGIGYGVLRYQDAEAASVPDHAAPVSFNYLGQFRQLPVPAGLNIERAAENAGGAHSVLQPRTHLIDITGGVAEGKLHVAWMYSENRHDRQTVERWSSAYIAALQEIIDHCRMPGVGRCTASDFPLSGLNQRQIETLVGNDRDVEDVYPLSPTQTGMLYHTLHGGQSGDYAADIRCTFTGDFDVAAFQQAWAETFQRHAVLRSSVAWRGVPYAVQVVRRSTAPVWKIEDFTSVPVNDRDAAAERFADELRAKGINVEVAPLCRFGMARVDTEAWRFVWIHHHVMIDGWSMPRLMTEVLMTYQSLAGKPAPPVSPSAPFRDYIAWRQDQRDEEAAAQFWRDELVDWAGPTKLRIERAVDDTNSEQHHNLEHRFSVEESTELRQFLRQNQWTLSSLMQAVWSLAMARFAATDDVTVGSIVSGRSAPVRGIESMIGLFINALPIRNRIPQRGSFARWIDGVQSRLAAVREHEDCAMSEIQNWIGTSPQMPLFEAILNVDNYPVNKALDTTQLGFGVRDIRFDEHSNFPLALVVGPGDEISFRVSFYSGRYDSRDVQSLLDTVVRTVRQLVETPDIEMEDLTFAEPAPLHGGAGLPVDEDVPVALHTLIERQCELNPDAVAVVTDTESWTYARLDAAADAVASSLIGNGVRVGDRVVVALERSPEMLAAMLGSLKVGAMYVPIDVADPPSRRRDIVRDAEPRVLFVEQAADPTYAEMDRPAVIIERAAFPTDRPGSTAWPLANADLAAYMIYTSGSTGTPKGVVVSHRSVLNFLAWSQGEYPLTTEDRVLQKAPAGFDAAVWEIFAPLTQGATVVLPRPGSQGDVGYLAELIQRHGVRQLKLVPSLLRALVETGHLAACDSLEHIFSGGEALPADLLRAARTQTETAIHNLYGPTECTVDATWCDAPAADFHSAPIGLPLTGTITHVLDDRMQPVPAGAPGELYVGGACLAIGYWNDAARTAERFVPDPFGEVPGARLYRTGDLVRRLPTGELVFLDRIDDQIKLRGFRIELGEIESALRTLPDLADAACYVHDASETGPVLHAVVVVRSGASFDEAGIRDGIAKLLPHYMLPARYASTEELPQTVSGKVDRRRLHEFTAASISRVYEAPEGPEEERMCSLFEDLLNVERIGRQDDFFERGGHSILLLQLLVRVEKDFGAMLPFADLPSQITPAALARLLVNTAATSKPACLVPIQVSGSRPSVFFIHPGGGHVLCYFQLGRYLGQEFDVYGLQARGLDGLREPATSVEEMAAEYRDAIRSVQPDGPCILIGHSAGGPIAYETARQLTEVGHDVARLVILDAHAPSAVAVPENGQAETEVSDAELLSGILGVLGEFTEGRVELDREAMRAMSRDELFAYVLRELEPTGLVPPGMGEQMLQGLIATTKSIHRSLGGFAPRTEISVPITLIRAADQAVPPEDMPARPSATPSTDWGWSRLSSTTVEVLWSPGQHVSMLAAPHAEQLAATISDSLGKQFSGASDFAT